MSQKLRLSVLSVLLIAPWAAGAEEPLLRTGWHGETMPEGIRMGDVEGEYVWERDSAVMVYVPPGEFTMGSDDGQQDERPAHPVWLDGYYIDKLEVSWRLWKESGLPFSDTRGSRQPYPEAPDWGIRDAEPVVNVSWGWARKYAAAMGKRLPTEAEWEKAARGTDGRTYPWGNEEPTFERAVWRYHPVAKESMAEVGCCEAGASPYGALNMAGNVYEWCEDVYDAKAYGSAEYTNPLATGEGHYRVLRGGAFLLEVEDLRSALRYRLFPADRGDYIGFRTVISQDGGGCDCDAPAGDAPEPEARGR